MKRFLQFLTMLPVLLLPLVLCNGCEEASKEVDESEEIATYTISFETNGGSTISAFKVESGSKITQPTDPTKDGYSFDNWYSDTALTQRFDFALLIIEDITIYARWVETNAELPNLDIDSVW